MKAGNTRLFCILFFATFSSFPLFAQIPANAIEVTGGIGKVVRNHPDFPEVHSPAANGSISLSKHFNGRARWHRYYNYPRMGLSLNGGSLGNTDVLGYYAGMMVEMTFEKRIGTNWFWGPRLSLGLAWFSDPYNEGSNPGNVAVGSELTFLAGAEVIAGRRISNDFDCLLKAGIIHASNSHFKLPNVGLNLPLVSLGVRYHWQSTKKPAENFQPDTNRLETSRRIRPHLRFGWGINEFGSSTGPVNGPKYFIALSSFYFSKMYSPVNKVTAGIEAWYNMGTYDFIVSQEFYDSNRHMKSFVAAIVLGHEFLMGHFGLITTGGIYIYNPFYKDRMEINELTGFKDKLKSIIPLRIGAQYYLKNTCTRFKNNLFVGVYIKTNFGQADFLETGVGYMF